MKYKIDTTRASRDGHEFHETWTARKALQLFWPDSELVGIAVEGLSPEDQFGASKAAVEIADIALYFGEFPSFNSGARKTIVQFKYSISNKDKDFRATSAKKTINKFAKTYTDYKKRYSAQDVSERLDFQLITNQPIYKPLIAAVEAIANGSSRTGEAKRQADQFITAAGLKGKSLAEFAAKVKFVGRSVNLQKTKDELENLLVDWSGSNDPIAGERLGRLKDLIKKKAGYAGTNQNLITRPDILAALKVSDADDLLPCQPHLVDVGPVVVREQLSEALDRIENSTTPALIHAAGGVGKTVFMESLARRLEETNKVVFFDCFGGGAYRSLDDSRHQPKQGIIHIANTLAFRGMCDPMLPETLDEQSLMRTFRRRLKQCIKTISRVMPGRKLFIFIDAIDNAEIVSRQRSEDAFPVKLLESLDNDPIDGVKVIVSCRSHRKPCTYAKYHPYELHPFSRDEARTFLRARLKGVTEAEINVAQARSGGNPRVLDYLLLSDRGLLDASEIDNPLELNDLIQQQITDAVSTTILRGCEQDDVDAFLAGLAVLPPPVPLDEYAGVHGIELSAVESFASDLAPLLERTNQGLIFKDEPTETLVRERYASLRGPLNRLAENLFARQDESVYAARALPGLLHELDDGERLFSLAFDDRIPGSVTSTVGKRNIRYARLKAASLHAAIKKDYNRLVRLLVELSTIAAVDLRGARYIFEYPDLALAVNDNDMMRRLFETRSGWAGARHARLAIVNTLSGDKEEAYRHVFAAHEWIEHAMRNKENRLRNDGPERLDKAALPFFMITHGIHQKAAPYLTRWYDWYAFEVCEHLFNYSHFAQSIGIQTRQRFNKFINSLTALGHLSAALSFCRVSKLKAMELIKKLSSRCQAEKKLRLPGTFTRAGNYDIEDGLRKSSALALKLGLTKEALTISLRARHDRPAVWSFRESYRSEDIFVFIFRKALVAAAKSKAIHEKDLLPKELVPICAPIPKRLTGQDFLEKAKDRLSKVPNKPRNGDKKPIHPHAMSYEENKSAERFISTQLQPLLSLTKALSSALAASSRQIDKRFIQLVEIWKNAREKNNPYRTNSIDSIFQSLGLQAVRFVLWTRYELKEASVHRFLTAVHAHKIGAANHIRIIAILARRRPLHAVAGEEAAKARELIQGEDDVAYRAKLYADLARAMLPASTEEASHYFREGLEQMDAIGSDDYEYTNELLLLASTIKGDELDERDFHTLSNVAELNLGDEPQKFFWGAYGRGLAKAAGLRGLAKLSRWDDRQRISLAHTLNPYLIGLLEHSKIAPRDALGLNRLANPVEYHYLNTQEFAGAIRERSGSDPVVITALIEQYRDDNPGTWMESTTAKLSELADEALGTSSDLARHLSAALPHHARIRDTLNEQMNYRNTPDTCTRSRVEDEDRGNWQALDRIIEHTDPGDESSLTQAISKFNELKHKYNLKDEFFTAIRAKLGYAKRGDYLRHICALEHLFYYWKLDELKQAKDAWSGSSAGIAAVLKSLAVPLINMHADDLLSDGRVSGSRIKEISELTGIPMSDLILELIKVFAQSGITIPGAAWLAFASFICPQSSEGQIKDALSRLLRSDAAKLANKVKDGAWEQGLYPNSDFTEIAAGLIWRKLGSPEALCRWRAAHCMRDFAAFGRWHVIDALVERFSTTTVGPFQAAELKFYYMHARLWLLIALARIALDYPDKISKYKKQLLSVVTDTKNPHVLMKHFAARALRACAEAGKIKLSDNSLKLISNIDKSPYDRLKKKNRQYGGFYHDRPKDVPKPSNEFHLDYDFHKYYVDSLSRVFGKTCWEVEDMLSAIVYAIDPNVTNMYESGGRESQSGGTRHETKGRFQYYGQQLGWHALFLVAGQLLKSTPVIDDEWYNDPWSEWLGEHLLTRDDGLWLSDGTDRTPTDTREILLEPAKKGFAITGDRNKLLSLIGIDEGRISKELVVNGRWFSADGIRVEVTSVLVSSDKAQKLARKLIREDPMFVWLSEYTNNEGDDEYLQGDKKSYTPWIVCPSRETRIDEHDPYGASVANKRPRLASEFLSLCNIKCNDPFGQVWNNSRGEVCLRTQAWCRDEENGKEGPHPGLRLFCRASMLKQILTAKEKELLVLINLQRYEKEYDSDSRYTHSVGVALISRSLEVRYFKGRVNHLHEFRY